MSGEKKGVKRIEKGGKKGKDVAEERGGGRRRGGGGGRGERGKGVRCWLKKVFVVDHKYT